MQPTMSTTNGPRPVGSKSTLHTLLLYSEGNFLTPTVALLTSPSASQPPPSPPRSQTVDCISSVCEGWFTNDVTHTHVHITLSYKGFRKKLDFSNLFVELAKLFAESEFLANFLVISAKKVAKSRFSRHKRGGRTAQPQTHL